MHYTGTEQVVNLIADKLPGRDYWPWNCKASKHLKIRRNKEINLDKLQGPIVDWAKRNCADHLPNEGDPLKPKFREFRWRGRYILPWEMKV